VSNPRITVHVTLCYPLLSKLTASNLSSLPIVTHQFFTCIAQGDVDLRFPLLLLTKASAVEEETK
jgi:hypothetical protein